VYNYAVQCVHVPAALQPLCWASSGLDSVGGQFKVVILHRSKVILGWGCDHFSPIHMVLKYMKYWALHLQLHMQSTMRANRWDGLDTLSKSTTVYHSVSVRVLNMSRLAIFCVILALAHSELRPIESFRVHQISRMRNHGYELSYADGDAHLKAFADQWLRYETDGGWV